MFLELIVLVSAEDLTKKEGIIGRSKKGSIKLVNKLSKKDRYKVRSKETCGKRKEVSSSTPPFCMALQVNIRRTAVYIVAY